MKSVTLLNLVTRSHKQVHTDINFLLRLFDRPTIEESFGKMDPQSQEIEKFGKGTQGKRKQKYENHIKVL